MDLNSILQNFEVFCLFVLFLFSKASSNKLIKTSLSDQKELARGQAVRVPLSTIKGSLQFPVPGSAFSLFAMGSKHSI